MQEERTKDASLAVIDEIAQARSEKQSILLDSSRWSECSKCVQQSCVNRARKELKTKYGIDSSENALFMLAIDLHK